MKYQHKRIVCEKCGGELTFKYGEMAFCQRCWDKVEFQKVVKLNGRIAKLQSDLTAAIARAEKAEAEREEMIALYARRFWGKCSACVALNSRVCAGRGMLESREECHKNIRCWAAHEAAKRGTGEE